ncbi:hypothetical protein F5884DRAFT_850372 [Xylogone sp. PMI_703]|nr:hypothetical protein F5884DRAFT_850372 [Xylogone sp. PMI_703]
MENEGDFLQIDIDSSDESNNTAEKVPRDFQSEADFQQVKAGYKAKEEAGELWKDLCFPINNPSKAESQLILHSIEELYFFRRYQEAEQLAVEVLKGELTDVFRSIVLDYKQQCAKKLR